MRLVLSALALCGSAHAADQVVPAAFVDHVLELAPTPPQDAKDREMAASGMSGHWMPIVLVYDRAGALRQAYNGPFDTFLATPLDAGRLAAPVPDGLAELQRLTGAAPTGDHDYIVVLLTPDRMREFCAPCKFGAAEVASALQAHAIKARIIDLDFVAPADER